MDGAASRGYNLRRQTVLLRGMASRHDRIILVNNYKCLVGVDFPLTPIHVIIGQNDSGKTNLLEAMLALSRSTTDRSIKHSPAMAGSRLGLCRRGRLRFSSRSISVPTGGDSPPMTYHLDVDSMRGGHVTGSTNGTRLRITSRSPARIADRRGCRRRDRETGDVQEHLGSIAGQLGPASLYRFDPH